MALDDKQKQWLTRLNAKATAKQALDKRRAEKEALTLQVRHQISEDGDWLFERMNLEVSDGKHTQRVLNYGLRDQTTEFDLDEMLDGYALESEEDLAKHAEAGRFLNLMVKNFDKEVDELDENGQPTGKKVPLFSKEELAEEYYRPLVREGLMPETMVPNEFSETKEMLTGSMEAYQERLNEEYAGGKKGFLKRMWAENGGVAKSLFNGAVSVTGSINDLNSINSMKPSDFDPKWGNFTDGQAGNRFTDVFLGKEDSATGDRDRGFGYGLGLTTLGLGLLSLGDDAKDSIKDEGKAIKTQIGLGKSDPESSTEQPNPRILLAGKLAQTITCQTGMAVGELLKEGGLGIVASSTFNALLDTSKITKSIAADAVDASHVKAIIDVLVDAVSKTFASVDPKTGNSTTVLTQAGTAASTALKNALNSKKGNILAELQKTDDFDPNKVLAPFVTGASDVSKISTDALNQLLANDTVADSIRLRMSKTMNDAVQKEEEEDRKREEAEWESIKNEQSDRLRAGKLERKILSLQRKRRWISMGAGITNMGLSMATKAFGPLAIAGTLFKMILAIKDAIAHTTDFIKWHNSQRDMFRAASPYSAPLANFIDNAALQAIHAEMTAAVEAVNMLGAIIECAGGHIGVAVGKGLQAGATIAGAIENILYEAKKRYNLEMAWQSYKLAMVRPENRKLGLIAMKKNPTLAKYAVAWGAVIKKDPLVSDFMARCGLDADTLKDPKANVSKVVTYLEARMPEDITVTGRKGVTTDWAPGTIELTVACWTATKKRGETKAELVVVETPVLESTLARFDTLYKSTKNAPDRNATQAKNDAKACYEMINTILAELNGYKAIRSDSKKKLPHRQMEDLVGEFKAIAQERLEEIQGWPKS